MVVVVSADFLEPAPFEAGFLELATLRLSCGGEVA